MFAPCPVLTLALALIGNPLMYPRRGYTHPPLSRSQ
jgi:hypothetical protein